MRIILIVAAINFVGLLHAQKRVAVLIVGDYQYDESITSCKSMELWNRRPK